MVPAELAGWCVRAVEADSESDPPLPRLGVSVLRHSKSTIRVYYVQRDTDLIAEFT